MYRAIVLAAEQQGLGLTSSVAVAIGGVTLLWLFTKLFKGKK